MFIFSVGFFHHKNLVCVRFIACIDADKIDAATHGSTGIVSAIPCDGVYPGLELL